MSLREKRNDELTADDAIQRVIESLSVKSGAYLDAQLARLETGDGGGAVRTLKNTALFTETQLGLARLRKVHLRLVQNILDNAKLKEMVNANISVFIGLKSGREIV